MTSLTAAAPAEKEDADPPERSLDKMAMAFGAVEDESALALAKGILAGDPKNTAAAAVITDLERRKLRKRFGAAPDREPPADLDAWIKEKQTARLIALLDDVCAEQDGYPGGVDLSSDWRVDALIRIGDPAVSALIDVIENDERLTRSVHSWRFGVACNILGVREAALSAVMSILRVQVFEAGFTGDNFTARGKDVARETAGRLGKYWEQYGKFPFDERMMMLLRDPAVIGDRLQEAAMNLAYIDDEVRYGTTVWTDKIKAPPKPREHPAISKFSNPTAAEAIFEAMKRDLAACDASKLEAGEKDYERQLIEATYPNALAALGDKRIAASLVSFAKAAANRQSVPLAGAAHFLGDPTGLASICGEFTAGKWTMSDDDYDFDRLLNVISSSAIPEAELALKALEDTKHPLRKAVISRAADAVDDGFDMPAWILRPSTLHLLSNALNDDTPTGRMYSPLTTGDNATRTEDVPQLISDQVAVALGTLIWTLPRGEPPFIGNAAHMDKLRKEVSRYRFRPETEQETSVKQEGEVWAVSRGLLPDIPPLGRPATPEDVAVGNAVFTLNGEGTVADLKLPAGAVFTADAGKDTPRTAIIVQAEKAKDGSVHYGALFRGGIGIMTDKELTVLIPFETEKTSPAEDE